MGAWDTLEFRFHQPARAIWLDLTQAHFSEIEAIITVEEILGDRVELAAPEKAGQFAELRAELTKKKSNLPTNSSIQKSMAGG
jgi:hypothetical protein